MRRRLLLPLLLLAACAPAARAELRLLASATSDSYQSLTYGLSAFCQAAGFPFALTEINTKATELLLIPNLAGVDVRGHLWLYWLASSAEGMPASDVLSVAILPTADNAAATLQSLANSYPVRTEEEDLHLLRYALQPVQIFGASRPITPVLYVAVRHGAVIVSASREAALWAANRPQPAPPAGAQAVAGQVRIALQPAVLSALLAEGRADAAGDARVREVAELVLGDLRALTLVLEATTEGVTLQLELAPRAGTPLARLFERIRPPDKTFWKFCPDKATFAMAGGGASLWQIPEAYATNRTAGTHRAADVLGDCLTGDSAMFIARTSPTGALYYAEVMGITDRAVAWRRALADPQALLPVETSFQFVTNGLRTVRGTTVLDLARSGFATPPQGSIRRNPADMAAFMVRDGGVSVAATSNLLVVTFGSSNAVEQVLLRLAAPPAGAATLPGRCRKLLPEISDTPCSAVLLQPAGLIREIAASLPGLKPERVAALPLPGDGMAATTTRDADGALHLTVRVSANEVARLQDAMSKGQAALQELFMQMALQQMLQMERRIEINDPRNPK